ncbi:beta-galactosidase family protein [Saccharibacillus sp. JS10]|uniref:glycoside hydrolase family 35 protein n=1 Tax=Saccharibacillus sp. JS10 TaxID=2950552 RepID=UPI00210E3602|nr:beta-galactosidase family protein [Saccharibacillus sp. JS10]MCQ4085384.1 beta-galactosidase [Saccharibacillus sp. JS10]
MSTFGTHGNQFIYNDEPITLLSGAIHYFRVVPEYWEDRLRKLMAVGFNTVETYVAWNVHEPKEGTFVFDDIADLEAFVRLAGKLGLHVIVRPSPYICAEWEFGGLPAWLLENGDIRLRCADPAFLEKVDAYFDELLPRLVPLLCTNGGPIIAMQIENEYGSYGADATYLNYLKDGMIRRGIDVLLFTSDGPEVAMLRGGSVEGILATVNFGSRTREAFEILRNHQPEGPLMVMEFWDGWFDRWLGPHHTRPTAEIVTELEQMLELQASFNFYMFHGGTNFGFMNGANHVNHYEPTVNSYDYDAILSEDGQPTQTFFAVRQLLTERLGLTPPELPAPLPQKAYGRVELTQYAGLFEQAEQLSGKPIASIYPEPMEKVGQAYGFILYTTTIGDEHNGGKLILQEVRDRALIFADGKQIGLVNRWEDHPELILNVPTGSKVRLDILVENMGRINYGPLMRDRKGITEGIRVGNQFLHGWEITPLPLESLEGLNFASLKGHSDQSKTSKLHSKPRTGESYSQEAWGESEESQPGFYRGVFDVQDAADTFIRTEGWGKGVIWINGFLLSRYWQAGPTKTAYIPAPLLRQGENEIVVFELHRFGSVDGDLNVLPFVELTDKPDLG